MRNWGELIETESKKPYFKELQEFIKSEYATRVIYPPKNSIFNALRETPLDKVKVVILGQDPYHEPNQAHGMSFSVLPGTPAPPSLINIYKEIKNEFGYPIPNNGYLMPWAEQGVLLLNTVLTVREHEANSHKDHGWEIFTNAVINEVNMQDRPIVYLLWGSPAQKKASMLNNPKHLILKTVHPSPLSAYRGFFGCNHFIDCNNFLEANGETPINWQIPNI